MKDDVILQVCDLQTGFHTDAGVIRAVDHVNLTLHAGETLGIVGESGSGKSVTALSIMRLLAGTTGRIDGGEILLKGRDLTKLNEDEMRKVRGDDIAMIFQEPMTCLNPVMRIGDQIVESILLHRSVSRTEARALALKVLEEVQLPRAQMLMRQYPFQLSGGQRQRVMVAMGLVCNPAILIADEPTTALDVTIQAQILELMNELKRTVGTSILFITHDLGVIAELCDRVVVMYCGRIVEQSGVIDLFDNPANPYTQGLMASIPRLGMRVDELSSIPGNVPNPRFMPAGCKFAPRCPHTMDVCLQEEPGFYAVGENHESRCWLHDAAIGGERRG